MKFLNQFDVMNNQSKSVEIVKNLINKARNENNIELISQFSDVLSTIYTVKNFNKLANCLYDGIHIVDADGVVVYLNDAFTRVTGFTQEIIGKHIDELISIGYIAEIALKAIQTNNSYSIVRENANNKMTIATTATPIFEENRTLIGTLIIDRDITELINLEKNLANSKVHLKNLSEEQAKRENTYLELIKRNSYKGMIGTSDETLKVKKLIMKIAPHDTTVLITGETGTGKEIVANEIYMNSNRSENPFIKVNCAAIPANLIESELFGYEKGAFTGANISGKAGLFEIANSGTILLDEIGDMPIELQSKLLRVIQEKEVTRIGGIKPIKLDVRIIASTNCNLYKLAIEGKFRIDLYYRLNLFPITIAPLRERKEDIKTLTKHFLNIFSAKYDKSIRFEDEQYDLLANYEWPGNIRELENIVERITIISNENNVINNDTLESILGIVNLDINIKKDMGLKEKVEELEKLELKKALEIGRSTRKAAEILKINQSNVVRKAIKYGIKLYDA